MNSQLLSQATQRLMQRLPKDPQVRAAAIDPAILASLRAAPTCLDALELACTAYAERPCLDTLTYAQLWQQVAQAASGWQQRGLTQGASVGILGFASAPWVVADLACLYAGAVSVPLQSSAALADLQHIALQTDMQWLVCNPRQLRLAADLAQACRSIRGVLLIDLPEGLEVGSEVGSDLRAVLPTGISVETLAALQQGANVVPWVPAAPDAIATLMYTSGSTGMPKGAMFTERAWRSEIGIGHDGIFPDVPTLLFNYLPMSHIMGRGSVLHTLMRGGCTHFVHNADMSTLLPEIAAARPTVLALVPRVSMELYQHYQRLRAGAGWGGTHQRCSATCPGHSPLRTAASHALGRPAHLHLRGLCPHAGACTRLSAALLRRAGAQLLWLHRGGPGDLRQPGHSVSRVAF